MTFQDELRFSIISHVEGKTSTVDDIITDMIKTSIELLIASDGVSNARCCLIAALDVVAKMESLNVKSLDTEPYDNA